MTGIATYLSQTEAETAREWIESTCHIPCDVMYSEIVYRWAVRVRTEDARGAYTRLRDAGKLAIQ
jgi:hypothetical protein